VRLDHTRPLAYLWPIDEYATCLCEPCNNNKKDRFPCDFYNEEKLRELARITKLPYRELIKRQVNEKELKRILSDIVGFANSWTPRTFNSVARKVMELKPEVDLLDVLRTTDEDSYNKLIDGLQGRPE
jgi:hypothetical protein